MDTPDTPATPDTLDAAALPPASPLTRDLRPLTPLWRISGRFTLRTPLHIGTGRDESITLPDRPGRDSLPGDTATADRHVATIARDHQGQPCIPASSFKGALAELARQAGLPQELQARLFGAEDRPHATTQAGRVEFVTLYVDPAKLPSSSDLPDFATAGHPHVAQLPHVSRNRHTGAAEHQRLYLQSVLPPGAEFPFECTARGLTEPEVAQLLGLLAPAGADASPLRLGAGQAADQGRIAWSEGKVQRIDSAAALWGLLLGAAKATTPAVAPPSPSATTPAKPRPGQRIYSTAHLQAHSAAKPATQVAPAAAVPTAATLQPRNLWNHPGLAPTKPGLQAAELTLPDGAWLRLTGLQLQFHSPFLVYQANTRKQPGSGEPDGVPRRDHQGRGLLPAHSLHGALRAQAERILRTVGRPAVAGYEVPGVSGLGDLAGKLARDELDLATLLFGAPGWRALLRCSDFVAEPGCDTQVQHLLAIDRLTGGGKDSAKFAIEVLDCPALTGHLDLDLRRLTRVEALCPGSTARALGLLAHVLRDLDDGDIPLGYGASKGYGQSTSDCAARLEQALQPGPAAEVAGTGLPTLPEALAAWAAALPPAPDTLQGANLAAASAPEILALRTPPAGAAEAEPDRFHNPYVFIPFPAPRPDDPHLPWAAADDLRDGRCAHHSHARYAADALHGELRCRLTTTTPVFIGAGDADEQHQAQNLPRLKAPYLLGRRPAIPATSLRGLVSSLHESLTGSALRVADDGIWSVRAVTEQALPLRGVFVGTKRFKLRQGDEVVAMPAVLDEATGRSHPIPDEVIMRLYQLADERTEETDRRGLPALPAVKSASANRIQRNPDDALHGNRARLMEGQRVFFRLDARNQVEELAWSAIWRKAVNRPAPNSHQPWPSRESLPQPELLPVPGKFPGSLSPSELLFGSVEQRPERAAQGQSPSPREAQDPPILAWMGKLRFSAALPLTPADERCGEEVTLKILSSPKPPSPSFYLQPRKGPVRAISKAELAQAPDQYQWRGRKAYLHALRDADQRVRPLNSLGRPDPNGLPPWKSHPTDAATAAQTVKQKVRVTPLAAGNRFEFTVRFSNLSRAELESLCAALRPDEHFQHKIGMGKPIGLGSVKIELVQLRACDRSARYRQFEFSSPAAVSEADPVILAERHMARSDPAVRRALQLIGNPDQVKYPVHYPQVQGKNIEGENFTWFVTNDAITQKLPKETRQPLEALHAGSTALNGLHRRRRGT